MIRLCLDLNVWGRAFISRRLGRDEAASLALVETLRSGQAPRGPVALVISWGMLDRLRAILVSDLGFAQSDAARLTELIAHYAKDGPSAALGGVGVLPIHEGEDRHVLDTAWAGQADMLATANLAAFVQDDAEVVLEGRIYRLRRGAQAMILAHPFEALRWLREALSA